MNFSYIFKRFIKSLKTDDLKITLSKIYNYIFFSSKINLDKFIVSKDENLDNIFIRFGTDKGSIDGKKIYEFNYKNKKNINYNEWIQRTDLSEKEFQYGLNSAPFYEELFNKDRDKQIKILEIGVANGHSIASWQQYFYNGLIFGIDRKKISSFFYRSKRIKYKQVDIFNKKQVNNFLNNFKFFDYIIDDSLHEEEAIIKNLINFFPSLKKGGVYFIEDFKGVDYFKKKVRDFNEKNSGKYMLSSPHTIREILNFLNDKNHFKSPFINEENQTYLFDQIEKVKIYDPEEKYKIAHPLAAIGAIYKKK